MGCCPPDLKSTWVSWLMFMNLAALEAEAGESWPGVSRQCSKMQSQNKECGTAARGWSAFPREHVALDLAAGPLGPQC